MQTYKVTKVFEFSCAHRLPRHLKCGRLHGHNYRLEVTVVAQNLSEESMVLDFAELKRLVQNIVGYWDHRYLVASQYSTTDVYAKCGPGTDMVFLPVQETSAECLAEHIGTHLLPQLEGVVKARSLQVKLFETPTCWATFTWENENV